MINTLKAILSDFIVFFNLGEISHLDLVRPLKVGVSSLRKKVEVSTYSPVSQLTLWLIQHNPNEVPESKVWYFSNEPDFPSGSVFKLAPFTDDESVSD